VEAQVNAMRFSAVFEPRIMPIRIVQGEERALPANGAPAEGTQAPQDDVPEDLDQRVRQVGEWQLEDW
jgi:hypothetical protein